MLKQVIAVKSVFGEGALGGVHARQAHGEVVVNRDIDSAVGGEAITLGHIDRDIAGVSATHFSALGVHAESATN